MYGPMRPGRQDGAQPGLRFVEAAERRTNRDAFLRQRLEQLRTTKSDLERRL